MNSSDSRLEKSSVNGNQTTVTLSSSSVKTTVRWMPTSGLTIHATAVSDSAATAIEKKSGALRHARPILHGANGAHRPDQREHHHEDVGRIPSQPIAPDLLPHRRHVPLDRDVDHSLTPVCPTQPARTRRLTDHDVAAERLDDRIEQRAEG